MGERSLMNHLKEKEGFCNGITMNDVFSYIFDNLAEGAAAFLMAQTMKYGNTSQIYEEEFKNMFDGIKAYQTNLYQNCSIQICSGSFQHKFEKMLKSRVNPTDLNETLFELHEQFPYLDFLFLRMVPDTPSPPKPNSHVIGFMDGEFNGSVYRAYALKAHEVSNEKGSQYQLVQYFPLHLLDYEFRGMKIDNICEEGMSICDLKIYVNSEDAGCFHNDYNPLTTSARGLLNSPSLTALSVSFGIIIRFTLMS
jgi:hypothetical protein